MKTIDDINVIQSVPPPFPPEAVVAFDIELFGMKKGKFHRPIGEFASFSMTSDGVNVYVIQDLTDFPQAIAAMANCGSIAHNAAFDIFHIRRFTPFPPRKPFYDTMLLDRILYNGYYGTFRLADVARRHLGVYMDKETVSLFENAKENTPEMIRYNAIDSAATWRVWWEQMKKFKKSHHQVWNDIDCPAMWAFLDFKAPMFDRKAWMEFAEKNAAKAAELKADFTFNPNASKQVVTYLNKNYHLMIPNSLSKTLARHKDNPVVARLLEYRKVEKRRSTYGKSWLKHIEEDDRVYTHYDVSRAESGRTASSDPNLQNIPVRDTPEYRKCVIAPEGSLLVGGDFGQQEIRIIAWLSKDATLIELLQDTSKDVYSEIGSILFKKPITKADEERNQAKALFLGLNYGKTAWGLARDLHIKETEAEDLITLAYRQFPDLARWLKKQVQADQYVRTPYKRKCWLNPYNGQIEKNACNSPCQGGGADMIKLATSLLHQEWDRSREPFPAVLQVHDEIDLEVLEANVEYAKELLYSKMLEAGNRIIPGVPVSVDIKVGKTWYDIH